MCWRGAGCEGRKQFFFRKKRTKKNFAPLRAFGAPAGPTPAGIKVFFASFLFTKKKTLLFFEAYFDLIHQYPGPGPII
jgi:hypothetical protein